MTPQTIWAEAQNRPTLVVRDVCARYPEVDPDFVYEVLLRRGVFKWLAVRRQLVRLKDLWRDEVRGLCRRKTPREKGYLEALERCRAAVRGLCHGPRWQAPDNDRPAQWWLERRARTEGRVTPREEMETLRWYVDAHELDGYPEVVAILRKILRVEDAASA